MRYIFFISICIFVQSIPVQPNSVYTTFIARYPDQKTKGLNVFIRGDGCSFNWTKGIQMNHTSANQWKVASFCAQNISISVKILLNDSVWMFGNNVIFNGGSNIIQIFPSFYPSSNKIQEKTNINSKILQNTRKCSIYYPPSYFDNTLKKYQILIMHDGQNLFNNSQAAFGTAWMVQNAINTFTAQGKMREIIVLGVWNTPDRNNQYTYSYDSEYKVGGKGDKYLDFLQQQLIPLAQGNWVNGRSLNSYSIGGSSLGGLISCYATYTRPIRFPKAICMSSSFWWNNQDFDNKIIAKFIPKTSFYLDSGDSGPSQDGKNTTITVLNHLKSMGYVMNSTLFYYLDKGGQHSQSYWGKRVHIPFQYLFP